MNTRADLENLTVTDYLDGELRSEIRHEYINGQVHAMVGASDKHNLIALNIATALLAQARSDGCQVFIADMKVSLNIAGEDIFYYPDVMVCCDPLDRETYFRKSPCLIVEVLSPATQRIDRREKFLAYTSLPSLEDYMLVAQDRPQVTLFQRRNDWKPLLFGPGDGIEFHCRKISLPVDDIYETISFDQP